MQLSASWRDDALPDRNVTVSWSNGGSAQAHFCATDKAETRAWFSAPGEYALTFSADDGLLKSSKTVKVTVTEAVGKVPADYCRFGGGVLNVTDGKIAAAKSEKTRWRLATTASSGRSPTTGIRSAGRFPRRGPASISCG